MSKPRKNAPALYELIGTRSRLSPPGPPGAASHDEEPDVGHPEEEGFEEEHARSILGPGRMVRMPVGYFFFGLAIIIAIGVGAYMLGFKARDRAYDRLQRQQAQAEVPDEPLESMARDLPVNESLLSGSGSTGRRPASGTEAVSTPSGSIETGAGLPPGRVIVVEGGVADPRVPDSNYAIVASLGRERAEDLARFLADRGLDVAVVKLNNARLHSVVPLRGFPRGTFGSEERRQFDAALKRVGREYAALGNGRKSFDDLYWDKY